VTDLSLAPVVTGPSEISHGAMKLSLDAPKNITALLPHPNCLDAVNTILKSDLGLKFPAPSEVVTNDTLRLIWNGLDHALLLGASAPLAPLAPYALLADQSGALARFTLTGPDLAEVLARLCPLDLRPTAFGPRRSARSLLGHIDALFVISDDGDHIEIFVMRSMAQSALTELAHAMQGVAARRSAAL